MKKTISKYDFTQQFINIRPDNFSYNGLNALFDYLEEYEECTGAEIELDVIAICCDFTEYENIKEFVLNYDDSYIAWKIEPEEADESEGIIDYEKTLDNIREYTQVIDIDGTSFIIQNF